MSTLLETLQRQRRERDALLGTHYLRRATAADSPDWLQAPWIKLITGPRRAGKSVLALMLLRDTPFAYLNFDDTQLLDAWDEDRAGTLLDDIYPGHSYLLLDEVQNLPGWEAWVGKLYRRGQRLMVTGSNSRLLSGEMATALTGRFVELDLLPFSLSECLEWQGLTSGNALAEDFEKAKSEYLHLGGFPETLQARSVAPQYLASLFDSILLRDVARRHNVRNTDSLLRLANYLLGNFANPLSINNLANDLQLGSVATAQKFCRFLTEPYLFYFLPRFNNKLKLMLKAPRKAYTVDNGIITSTGGGVGANLGRLLENQVFVELVRQGGVPGRNLFYYQTRNNREIDFVVTNGGAEQKLVQVCYNLENERTRRRELDALAEAADELGGKELTIVTWNEEGNIAHKGHSIELLPIDKL